MFNISQGCHLEVVLGERFSWILKLFCVIIWSGTPPNCASFLALSLKHLTSSFSTVNKYPSFGNQSENLNRVSIDSRYSRYFVSCLRQLSIPCLSSVTFVPS